MVGVPRSKGCRVCVQRRVRCDLTRPVCNNCKKGNRPCPGFDSDLRIQDEGSKLRKRFATKEVPEIRFIYDSASPVTSNNSHSSESSPEDSLGLVSRFTTPAPDSDYGAGTAFDGTGTAFDIICNQTAPGADILNFPAEMVTGGLSIDQAFLMAINGSVYSPHLAQEQLLSAFSNSIAGSGPLLLPQQMRNHTNWLSQLPGFFGSKLLDTAVRAVSLIHLGRVQQSEVFVQESRPLYGQALHLLNKALSNDANGMSTETLSATVLLSFYEMFASDSNRSWVQHSGGAAMLMRIRGPDRHLSGLDRDVYLAYRHTIIIDAFMHDDACFLAEPQWLEMSKKIHQELRQTGIQEERMEIFDLAEEFYLEHLQVPSTLKDARGMDEVKKRMTPEQFSAHTEMILARTRMHRANLKSINVRLRAALSKQGLATATMPTNDPIFPTQYIFPNVFVASTHTGHWTIMMILNLILKEIEKDILPEKHALYLMENREMCREICRTVPFMLTSSFLGPFFSIFALRMCLMVFEAGRERDWVIRKLTQIGNTHMKMAADIPQDHDSERTFREVEANPSDLQRLEEIA